jgi:hypothetical protein
MTEKLLTEDEVSQQINRAKRTLQKDRVYGRGIPFVKVFRKVFYRESDVDAYLASLPSYRSTSEISAMRGAGGRPCRSRSDRDGAEPQPPAAALGGQP